MTRVGWPVFGLLVLLAAVPTACEQPGREGGGEPAAGEPGFQRHPHVTAADLPGFALDTIASGLVVPWDLDFAPDGRIFLTERPGRIRIIRNGALQPEPWAELAVFGEHPDIKPESGLLGIALCPDFAETGHVYVFATISNIPDNALRRFAQRVARRVRSLAGDVPDMRWESRVYRLTDRDGRGTDLRTIIDRLPASYYHAGGALAFGPDGRLYLTTGDVLDSERAQDRASLVGAVLRFEPDGTIPADNPVPGSPVYAHGLRNVQGLAWHPETGELFVTEHGPSFLPHEGGRHGKDEINVIVPGGNYGWPVVAGDDDGNGRFESPLIVWSPAIAPPALAFYSGCDFPWVGDLLVTGLRGQQLRRLSIEPDADTPSGWTIQDEEALLQGSLGRLRAVATGPSGELYVTTSNRDGRGEPRPDDDLLLRLRALPEQRPPECDAAPSPT
jgi:aldose sugar dehydrogenase